MDNDDRPFDHSPWREWLLGPLFEHLHQLKEIAMATQAQVTALTTAVAALVAAQAQSDIDLKQDFTDVAAEIALAASNAGVSDPALDAALTSLNTTIADIGTQDAAVQAQNTAMAASQAAGGPPPAPKPAGP